MVVMPFSDIVQDESGLPLASRLVKLTQLSHPIPLLKQYAIPTFLDLSCNAVTEHGCKYEKQALAAYELGMKERHVNFKVKECGMFANQEHISLAICHSGFSVQL